MVASICTTASVKVTFTFICFMHSSGFAVETQLDNKIPEGNGNQRKIICGTETGNHRTAGTNVNGEESNQYINKGKQ